MPVARGDAVALAHELVRVDSRNPSLSSGAPGERAVALALAAILESWGFAAELRDAAPGRPNVIARIGCSGAGPSLMFNGHLDTVGVEGMSHDPWSAERRGERMYGRGSCDMKSGIAAMCAAAVQATDALGGAHGEIIIAAVVDEEFESAGTRALIEWGVRADAAIVTEPTRLCIMPAHRGFVWADVIVHGVAAHGSRWELGVDAIRHAGLYLAALDEYDANVLPRREHPLLGRPSVHASLIEGGTGMSTYPDRCVVRLERRTIPGESAGDIQRELVAIGASIAERRPTFRADVRVTFAQSPSDVALDAPVVRALEHALRVRGEAVQIEGMSAWTDAALLNDAGIPAICFGPGDIAFAHAAVEYVPIDEIGRSTAVLGELAQRWVTGRGTGTA
jgi:acetylornithine deacetylase